MATTLLSLDSERTRSCGSAVVETIPVPCRPPLVPVGVDAPYSRLNIAAKVAALTRSDVADELGLRHDDALDALLVEDLHRGRPERVVPHDVAGEQPLRLLGERGPALSASVFFEVDANASASPRTPLTRNWSASISCWCTSRRCPGGSRVCARSTFCCSWSASPLSLVTSSACLIPGVTTRFLRFAPIPFDARAIAAEFLM